MTPLLLDTFDKNKKTKKKILVCVQVDDLLISAFTCLNCFVQVLDHKNNAININHQCIHKHDACWKLVFSLTSVTLSAFIDIVSLNPSKLNVNVLNIYLVLHIFA